MRFVFLFGAILLIMTELQSAGSPGLAIGPVKDKRFEVVRHLRLPYDLSYMSSRYKTLDQWEKRAADLRELVLTSAGLNPFPEKTPLNAEIFGRIEREDYTVERVRFQSWPGLYVLGNLYRPKGQGPFPAVLNPHGHFATGRFENTDIASVPGRCINFAKQGYIAFSYDMVGYGESNQMPHEGAGREEGLWDVSLGGIHLWNSIRGLDFLESLPDVDRNRIACTGASGGGTQTFLLTAVDDRVKVSAPVNMISAHMQGGCRCENLPGLRIDTNNVEISALMAPRPMIMVAATGDWTKDTPQIEFPAVQSVYKLFGAEKNVSYAIFDAGHNYFKDSREAVYSWFGQWLPEKALEQPVKEQPFEAEKKEDLLALPNGKYPDGALTREELFDYLKQKFEAQLESYKPRDSEKLEKLRQVYMPLLRRTLSLPKDLDLDIELRGEQKFDGFSVKKIVLKEKNRGAQIPALHFEPIEGKNRTVLMVHDTGKGFFLDNSKCSPGNLVAELLKNGRSVILIDCFNTGENTAPAGAPERDQDKDFFDTYNITDTAERVFDILAALEYIKKNYNVMDVSLAGFGQAGLWSLLARPFADNIKNTVIDSAKFNAADDQAFLDNLYAPGLKRAGDLRVAAALCAPGNLFIHNTDGKLDISFAEAAYKSSGKDSNLTITDKPASEESILHILR